MKTVRYIGVLDDEIIAVRGMVFQLEKLLPQAEVKGFTQFREFELWCENNAPELVFFGYGDAACYGTRSCEKNTTGRGKYSVRYGPFTLQFRGF